MTQNIEQRTEAAVSKYEGAAGKAEQFVETDSTVSTTAGPRKSFPKLSREIEGYALESLRLGVANRQGVYAVGATYDEPNWTYTYNGQQWGLSDNFDLSLLPYETTQADPNDDDNLSVHGSASTGYVNQAQGEVVGGRVFPESGVLASGMLVPENTTHLRVLIEGDSTIVTMSRVAYGIVTSLTEAGATIGFTPVEFKSSVIHVVNSVEMLASRNFPAGSFVELITSTERRSYVITTSDKYPRIDVGSGLYASRIYSGDTLVMNTDDWNLTMGGWHLPPYTQQEYDTAFNNGKSIQAACEYADEIGLSKVISPKGVLTVCYYDADNSDLFFGRDVEAQRGLESLDYSPSITLFDMNNLTLDLSKTSLQVIFDSDNRSPYDLVQRGTPAEMYGKLIFPRKTENLTIIFSNEMPCIGDVRCRSWITDPVNTEKTLGIFISQMNYNLNIYGGKNGGFTGDFITGGFGQPCGEGYPYPTLQSLARGGFDESGLEDDTLLTNRRSAFIQLRFPGGEEDLTNFNIRDNVCSLSGFGYLRYPYIRNDNIGVYFYDETQTYLARQSVGFNDPIYCPDNVHYLRFEFYDDERTDEFVNYGDLVADSGALTLQTGISIGVDITNSDIVDNRRGGISNVPYSTTISKVRVFDSGVGEKSEDPPTTEFTRYAINCEDFVTNDLVIEHTKSSHSYANGFLISATKSAVKNCEVDTSIVFRRDCLEGSLENSKASLIDFGVNDIPDRQKMRPKISVIDANGWEGLNSVQHKPNTGPASLNRKRELILEQGNKFSDDIYTASVISNARMNVLQGFAVGGRFNSIEVYRNTPFSDNEDNCSMDLSGAHHASDIFFDSSGPIGYIKQDCILFNRRKNPYKNIRVETGTAISLTQPLSARPFYWDLSTLYMNDVSFRGLHPISETTSACRAYITPPMESHVVGGTTYHVSDCEFDDMMLTISRLSGATTNVELIVEDASFVGIAKIVLDAFSGSDASNVTITVVNSRIDVSQISSAGVIYGSVNDQATLTIKFVGCTFYNNIGGEKLFPIIDITQTAATISSSTHGCTFANCLNNDGITTIN